MSNPPLLLLSGPTATGKTSLALKLAKKFNGELISADSRQIYRGLDIGTGKDHPKNTKIHLIDIVDPSESFSVAQYQILALAKIRDIQSQGKLPIVVGGTGLYLDSLISPNTQTFSIKPNNFLRFFLNRFPLKLLQLTLRLLSATGRSAFGGDLQTFKHLNNSDKNNPRRLIRKIEILLLKRVKTPPSLSREGMGVGFNYLHLSLTAPNSFLFSKINNRIQERLNNGLLKEIKKLLKHYSWSDPGLNTLAYKEFRPYFQQKDSLENCLARWRSDEHAYARRQKTWFKTHPGHFLDITNPSFSRQATALVQKWYNLL